MNAISHDVLAAAKEDQESVIELTRDLVAIPSRGGVDSYEPVLDRIGSWLADRGLPAVVLKDSTGATVGLTCEIRGSRAGSRWVLDACLDTAPFGDERAWTHPPTNLSRHRGRLAVRAGQRRLQIRCRDLLSHRRPSRRDHRPAPWWSGTAVRCRRATPAASAAPDATSKAPALPLTWPA
ncbi:MAG: hypothetical protein ACRDUV_08175 [Pseudonocardiaceae bacterium]